MAYDLSAARGGFPILNARNYLASHALGPLPTAALRDLAEYTESLTARLRSVPLHLQRMEEVRGLIAQLLGCEPRDVALMPSATSAQASLLFSLSPGVGYKSQQAEPKRRRLLVSRQSFPSSRFLWEAQAARGFEVEQVENEPGGSELDRSGEALAAQIDERVTAVSVPLVAPYSGALLPLEPVLEACERMGALLILDAYQGLGSVPCYAAPRAAAASDQAHLRGPDAIVGGTHKWLCAASMGLALMYVEPRLAERLTPAAPGWLGDAGFPHFTRDYTPASGALRFQQGTPALEPIFGARAGLRFALEAGIALLRQRSVELTAALLEQAEERGLRSLTPAAADLRGGTVTFDVGHLTVSAQQSLLGELSARGIDVDVREDQRGGAGLRVSPHPCVALDDCNGAICAISELVARATKT